jgi:VWFA-related protein
MATVKCATRGLAAIAMFAMGGSATAQDPPAATFRSSIDLVRVDVSVLGKDGRPIQGLRADDFGLTVDGTARRVVTADFVAASLESGKAPATSSHYSTNADASGGRLIMFVLDQGTIHTGRARQVTAAAEQFVSRLSPSDRVGLITIPGMEHVDFTANHAVIRSQLQRMAGMAPPSMGQRQVGIAESLAISRGDTRAVDAAMARECTGMTREFERRMCRQELVAYASTVFSETRDRARNTITSLRSLLQRLAETQEPKTIILISGGLILDQDYGQLTWFGPLAARAQVTLYSIYLLAPHFEASLQRLPVHYREDMMLSEEGLGHVADLGRGSLFRLTTDAKPIFDRLELELSGYYLLGFEADAADRDERPHKIKVSVEGRTGMEVRARPEFSAPSTTTRTVDELLIDTIKGPLIASEIRLKATTYTMRDRVSQKLRVLIGAEVERARDTAGRLALAFGLFDSQGRLVASHAEPDVSTRINPRTGAHQYFNSATVDAAGVYMLKVAAVDDLRRRGSVEHTFRAELSAFGPVRAGELILAETGADTSGVADPVISSDYTSPVLHTAVELYADSVEVLKGATVTFEIADTGSSGAINSAAGTPPRNVEATDNARTLQAAIAISLLPPGEYVARAIIKTGGRTVGQVLRPFRVARAVVDVSRLGAGRTPAVLPSRLDAFDRRAVLSSDVVGFFLDRMSAKSAAASPDAMTHARDGRFDALLAEMKNAGNDPLSAAFLSGLALYARGELNAAAERFRHALKVDSEFFPAAFYLGACYAAGGRDREAANAWQTSLVTESDAPFIYPLIADALLRARDTAGAADILKEAADRWPENEQLQVRLAVAYVMAGRGADAVKTLDPYLSRHPDDHEQLFVMLRAIYEARNAGVSIETPEKDRERFVRYAQAYAAAGGPHHALVERWKKFLEGK